ncbi:aconitate hydratase 1 [Caldisphaera lagunensis DSM 15908]|uniref:aconitate hydratase n=1 Tax=Caldisphaera lagunensis (strain DSM 15908 / JCM 11604 / ANMR 0165 / IC-154) TaxID=1056495 RepID=L0A929_CALLD|nr:aconitate hydratase 1 [Caldisphaera lagunensis DSM 15908]
MYALVLKENIDKLFDQIDTYQGKASIVNLNNLDKLGLGKLKEIPYSMRILIENLIRNYDGYVVRDEDIENILNWRINAGKVEIPLHPARVVMQDFTGVPAVVDLATMRDAFKEMGKDPKSVNPQIPVDLIIDHSVQVDYYGTSLALQKNMEREFERNSERYMLLKWAQKSFQNFRVVPPGKGIIHQVNLEYLAKVIWIGQNKKGLMAYPDSVLGTDSHTTMINGLGVLGWGVGGIEAEAVILGQPYYMLIPEVIGVKLVGELKEGVTTTDLVLYITEKLRKKGVVGKFVEFYGEGIKKLSVPDRATLANMAPEYGATMGFFPIDDATIQYLLGSGRDPKHVQLVAEAAKILGLWYDETSEPKYSDTMVIDLGEVEPAIAGPANPEDRIPLKDAKNTLNNLIDKYLSEKKRERKSVTIKLGNDLVELKDGSLIIAAITSCTNTSNPNVMIAAGLLAKKAVERGLKVKPWVKTSNAPGSRVVTEYLTKLNLLPYLEALGFHITGYGCTVCIGNTGPLRKEIEDVLKKEGLYAAAVLSGNRNFSGRVHPLAAGAFLASPPLVVAYALAGRIDIDFNSEPIGYDPNGEPVYLKDIWPSSEELRKAVEVALDPKVYQEKYKDIFEGTDAWNKLEVKESDTFEWDEKSTYIKKPPFFEGLKELPEKINDIKNARVLVYAPDRTTTDHISPAGNINPNSKAGQYLISLGVKQSELNSCGSRRGNHEVMMRCTFDNPKFRNLLVKDKEGGYTIYWPTKEVMHIFDASTKYKQEKIPVIVLGRNQYGMGSSRDWAAKGPYLLGIKAVIAKNYERIHRSNLVGMGILPLEFMPNEGPDELGLDGSEIYDIIGIDENLTPHKILNVKARKENGKVIEFKVKARLDTPIEVEYYKHGGILHYVLRKLYKETK